VCSASPGSTGALHAAFRVRGMPTMRAAVLRCPQTMIAGGAVSIAMFAWVAAATHPSLSALVPFGALTAAVLLHMPFSVGFHLFRGISADVYNLWRRCAVAACVCVCVCVCVHA
jgi:hypothetical protein